MEAIEKHMNISQSEGVSGTMNELRAVVKAKLAKDTGVRVADDVYAPIASTVRMDASIQNSLILWET